MPSHHPVPQDLLRSSEPVLWGLDGWTAVCGILLAMLTFQLLTAGSAATMALAAAMWAIFLLVGFAAADGFAVRTLLAWAALWFVRQILHRPAARSGAPRLVRRA